MTGAVADHPSAAQSPWWFAGYQVVWVIAALGAASGIAWPGMMAAAFLVAVRLAVGRDRAVTSAVMAVSALAGFGLESGLAAFGLILYGAAWPSGLLAPGWLVGLWLAFGATLPALARLIGGWPVAVAALIGGIGAPFAYWGGARLGALTFAEPSWMGLAVLAVAWAVVLPALLALQRRLDG